MQTQTDPKERKSIDQHFYSTIHYSNSFNKTISTNEKDIQQSLQLRGIGEAADTMVFYGYNSALMFDMGLSSAVLSFITLVRTIPGLWSRMCSRVAAISISFTPELKTKQQTTIFSMPYFPKLTISLQALQVSIMC